VVANIGRSEVWGKSTETKRRTRWGRWSRDAGRTGVITTYDDWPSTRPHRFVLPHPILRNNIEVIRNARCEAEALPDIRKRAPQRLSDCR